MPYLANIDGIIWIVIIVGSIIGQIVKASRKVQAQAPKQASPRSRNTRERRQTPTSSTSRTNNPAEDLKQFFETLGVPIPEVVTPSNQTPETTQSYRPASRTKPQKNKQRVPQTAMPPPPTRYQQQPILALAQQQHEDVKLVRLGQKTATKTLELQKLLKSPASQRQAVMLREILGPPLAIR